MPDTETTTKHLWTIERRRGLCDWHTIQTSTTGPLSAAEVEWYRTQYPSDQFRQIHTYTITQTNRTLLEG